MNRSHSNTSFVSLLAALFDGIKHALSSRGENIRIGDWRPDAKNGVGKIAHVRLLDFG